jgi:hypothetical protein
MVFQDIADQYGYLILALEIMRDYERSCPFISRNTPYAFIISNISVIQRNFCRKIILEIPYLKKGIMGWTSLVKRQILSKCWFCNLRKSGILYKREPNRWYL